MNPVSRRGLLSSGAALGTATAAFAAMPGNPDEPAQGLVNTRNNPRSASDPGPQNPALAGQFPSAVAPPATDVGDLPLFWASFNNAPRRIQDGGWARQVTQADFAISESISGVNMRLAAGGVRELHWHVAAEWGFMTYGECRVTCMDADGRSFVADVKAGDLWYFPGGFPHSLQGLGPDGAEFILCFDNGRATEFNTLLLTDWMAHTPPEVLAANFGLPAASFDKIFTHSLWIYQGKIPGPLAADAAAMASRAGQPANPFTHALASGPISTRTKGGFVQVADSANFKASTTIAAALVTLHPGGLREMHWHPNADEWQYFIKGSARMTVFGSGPKAVTNDFKPGDIGYVKRSFGHYLQNTGDTDLVFLEVFNAARFRDISLSNWLAESPPAMVAEHLNLPAQDIARFPRQDSEVMPI